MYVDIKLLFLTYEIKNENLDNVITISYKSQTLVNIIKSCPC